jgi:hypothetical protein
MRGEVEATQHADSFIPLRPSTIAMTQYPISGNCWSPPPTFRAPGGVRLYARDPVLSDVTTDWGGFTGGRRAIRSIRTAPAGVATGAPSGLASIRARSIGATQACVFDQRCCRGLS